MTGKQKVTNNPRQTQNYWDLRLELKTQGSPNLITQEETQSNKEILLK